MLVTLTPGEEEINISCCTESQVLTSTLIYNTKCLHVNEFSGIYTVLMWTSVLVTETDYNTSYYI